MVSLSPRSRDSLEFDEPDAIDPRLSLISSLSHDSGFDELDFVRDLKPFAGTPDLSSSRRRSRVRRATVELQSARPFRYSSVADGDIFRLMVLYPATGSAPVRCRLIRSSVKRSSHDHTCLSYCWGESKRDEYILICLNKDGEYFKLPVTRNLHRALLSLRKPTSNLLLWVDQVCINQQHDLERAHQVSIMRHIYMSAREVIVWLGEEDARSDKLCQYAEKMRRGEDGRRSDLNRILPARHLQDALKALLSRPWFSRCWVIPEVALARHCIVQCGASFITWANLLRLIRDVPMPATCGFDKQTCLLGNPRQRIAILSEMAQGHKHSKAHTDIAQLLILAKASAATDVRDKIYAFYGLTHITTFPDYAGGPEALYVDIAEMYINAILYEESYAKWHSLGDEKRNFQLMSIIYSAGALHQNFRALPSWVPDWTYTWHLAPVWCKTSSKISASLTTHKSTSSSLYRRRAGPVLRPDTFRAGGKNIHTFELLESSASMSSSTSSRMGRRLAVSAVILDTIQSVNETSPPATPGKNASFCSDDEHDEFDRLTITSSNSSTSPPLDLHSPVLRYGRTSFETSTGYTGLAEPGVKTGDVTAIILGGDVPVVLRRADNEPVLHSPVSTSREIGGEQPQSSYVLLCECIIDSPSIMEGGYLWDAFDKVEDIVLV
ncbi:HET-domain-containing protein [Polychaeton citri CBS 116435]|uniref:HET-domain-containing protein n=1 Tax=Polychaeton citri CBS 116435 TaxID=1314669 RepID=A0A9P4PZ94_9PEZI|nr:HET-domain-containing protein [Polychaeton citri CBS 116435]